MSMTRLAGWGLGVVIAVAGMAPKALAAQAATDCAPVGHLPTYEPGERQTRAYDKYDFTVGTADESKTMSVAGAKCEQDYTPKDGTDPLSDPDPTWINMSAQVSGATFTFQSVTYTAPAAGSYRIGRFNERDPRLGGEIGNDVNRDGNPAGSSGIFAVLWSGSSNTVWVDVNQNNSFADETGMTDYKVNFDVGYFGTDNPATAIAIRRSGSWLSQLRISCSGMKSPNI